MRVLAARFPDRKRAAAALRALRLRLGLADDDAEIAPLGTPGRGDEGEQTLLAGRFDDPHTAIVRTIVADSGGQVVADVDEQWTRPRFVQAGPGAGPSGSAGTGHISEMRTRSNGRSRSDGRTRQPIVQ